MKTMIKWAVVAAAFGMLASPAMADMSVWMNYPDSGYTTYSDGGPFKATVTNGNGAPVSASILGHLAGSSFVTFCVETNEYFNPGYWYVVDLSKEAKAGGVGGGSPDPLSNAAAHLYLQYVNLSVADQEAQGAAYQQAIWWLEDEIGGDAPTLAATAVTAWGDKETVNYTGTEVRVMNLTDTTGTLKQDMLVSDPVPVPGAALLGAIGLGIVGWVKRRFA